MMGIAAVLALGGVADAPRGEQAQDGHPARRAGHRRDTDDHQQADHDPGGQRAQRWRT